MKYGIGQPVPRTEDPRFLRGQGRYVDDLQLPNQAIGYVLRSPHSHARINGIDISVAAKIPGVVAVLTGQDVKADGLGELHCHVPPMAFGGPMTFTPARPILADDRVRCLGEPVAFVVAESLALARDAAEAVSVDYTALPAAGSTADAVAEGASLVWEESPGNIWFEMDMGDKDATDAAFARAAHVISADIHNNRISANPIEPRATLAEYRVAEDNFTIWMSSQGTHQHRAPFAGIFGMPAGAFRIIAPDVGGGFGMKNNIFPEDALCAWAARRLNRPVKWTAERAEALVSDTHGRDAECRGEMALDERGRILALRVRADYGLGAYLSDSAPVSACIGATVYPNVYVYEAMHVHIRTVFSHTNWTGPYRGAGRPEAVYVVERLLDMAAAELRIDPVEIRMRNYVPENDLPYTTAVPTVIDSGDFTGLNIHASEIAKLEEFEARKAESLARGKLRGIGVCSFIDFAAPFNDRMEIRFDETGGVTVVAGTHSHGQDTRRPTRR